MISSPVTNVATNAAAVTPSDTVALTEPYPFALLIGTAGTLKVDTADGDTVTFGNVPAGILPLRVKQVYSTGTSATNIAALY